MKKSEASELKAPHDRVQFQTFAEFWPYYLSQHSKKSTRVMHLIGTTAGILAVIMAVYTHQALFVLAGAIGAYGMAWVSHFFIERNRPATFRYPLFSLRGDFKMIGFMIRRRDCNADEL